MAYAYNAYTNPLDVPPFQVQNLISGISDGQHFI
jgi:hypothetical protein